MGTGATWRVSSENQWCRTTGPNLPRDRGVSRVLKMSIRMPLHMSTHKSVHRVYTCVHTRLTAAVSYTTSLAQAAYTCSWYYQPTGLEALKVFTKMMVFSSSKRTAVLKLTLGTITSDQDPQWISMNPEDAAQHIPNEEDETLWAGAQSPLRG